MNASFEVASVNSINGGSVLILFLQAVQKKDYDEAMIHQECLGKRGPWSTTVGEM